MDKLLIIDGHNYLYRGYYGVPAAAKLENGLQVNAFYGFFSYLRKNIKHINPQNILVVFDSETGIESRIGENGNYKQNRDYSDTAMFEQLPIIKKALEYLNIYYIEDNNYEGDDVIGSIAYKESKKRDVYISTQDQDFFQLLKENLNVIRDERIPDPKRKGRYLSQPVVYDRQGFIDKWGFAPTNYIDYLALKGDPIDNIKGVEGIGRVRASKLVVENGDVNSILKESESKRLIGNEDLVRKNKEFLKINIDLDIEYKLEELKEDIVNVSSSEILEGLGIYKDD